MHFHSLTTWGHSFTTLTLTPHYCHYLPSNYISHHPLHWPHAAGTNLTLPWLHCWSHNHTHYISLGLPLRWCQVLFSLASLQSVLSYLVRFPVFWFLPVAPGLFSLPCPVWTLFAARLDYCSFSWILSLPIPLDIVCWSSTHTCSTDCSVFCPCHTCLLFTDPAWTWPCIIIKLCKWIRLPHVSSTP